MIPNYSPPRLTVDQILNILPQESADRLTAALIGPQYFLQRHAKDEAAGVTFAGTGTVLPYTGAESHYILDTDYTRVHGENLEAKLGELATQESNSFKLLSIAHPEVLEYGGAAVAGTDRDDSFFHGRDVKVGDIFRVGADVNSLRKRRVVALRGVTEDAVVGDAEPAGSPDTDNSGTIEIGGTYTGPKNTTYIIEATEVSGGEVAEVRITDSQGIDETEIHSVSANTAVDLGIYGLTADFTTLGTGWEVGDQYTVAATAESESATSFDKVVLDGAAIDNPIGDVEVYVDYRMPVTGELDRKDVDTPGNVAWTDGTISSGLTLGGDLRYTVPERTASELVEFASSTNEINNFGRVFLTFRALVPRAVGESYLTVGYNELRTGDFGVTTSQDNPLGFALAQALRGSAGKRVHAVRLAENTPADYDAVLDMLRDIDAFYVFVPLTDNAAVHRSMSDAMVAASTKTAMNWRAAYLGVNSPGAWPQFTEQSDGSAYTGRILEHGGANVLFRTDDLDLAVEGVQAGDIVRIQFSTDAWGDETYEEYVVKQVLGETEAILESGPATPVSAAIRFELWKGDYASSQRDFLNSRATALGNRRATQIWIENSRTSTSDGLEVVDNAFVAAYMAGLRSSLLPQQGLTRFPVEFLHSAPAMYTRYTAAILNDIAANGTFIVTQDITGGDVYVRHQVTTAVSQGILYYEDSVRTNVDMVAYEIRDALRPYVGRRNANRETLIDIRNALHNVMETKTTVSALFSDIGPALISYDILKLEIDPSMPDRIKVVLRLTVPTPLNDIDVTLGIGALTAEDIEDLDFAIAA